MNESVLDTTQSASIIANNMISCRGLHDNRNQNNGDQQSQNHNQSILDLHASAAQLPEGPTEERDHSTLKMRRTACQGAYRNSKPLKRLLHLFGADIVMEEQ